MNATETDRSSPPLTGDPTPQMQTVLDELEALHGEPIETLSATEARKQPTPTDAVKRVLQKQGRSASPDASVKAEDMTIHTEVGPVPLRVYTPRTGVGPFPLIVYYHGGGWVIADIEVYDAGPRSLSKLTDAVVVSVEYRQGPENRFPAAHDDAFAAYRWALANASEINADPSRVALAGESAGGGLAVATAIAARDAGSTTPSAIVSVYPIAGTDTTTPSYEANKDAKPLNRPMMEWFFENYLADQSQRQDPRVNLVEADLGGLPPVTIINAQIDPLRSDGDILAERLRDAGVPVTQKTFAGVTHEFFGMALVVDEAQQAQELAASAIKSGFGQ